MQIRGSRRGSRHLPRAPTGARAGLPGRRGRPKCEFHRGGDVHAKNNPLLGHIINFYSLTRYLGGTVIYIITRLRIQIQTHLISIIMTTCKYILRLRIRNYPAVEGPQREHERPSRPVRSTSPKDGTVPLPHQFSSSSLFSVWNVHTAHFCNVLFSF